jgi:hypothetical protein
MENVTLDRTTVLQLDADGTDRALDAAADDNVLGNDAALDLCAIADQKIRRAHLAFDSAVGPSLRRCAGPLRKKPALLSVSMGWRDRKEAPTKPGFKL